MMLHRIANDIIAEAAENGCTVIAFEELTGIRDRLSGASWGHEWAFERLYEYVDYKSELHGIDVEQVNPENTSRRCSTCGFTHPDNRDGEAFECLKCGYQNHADYNAAKNIGLRYLRRNQTGDGSTRNGAGRSSNVEAVTLTRTSKRSVAKRQVGSR